MTAVMSGVRLYSPGAFSNWGLLASISRTWARLPAAAASWISAAIAGAPPSRSASAVASQSLLGLMVCLPK